MTQAVTRQRQGGAAVRDGTLVLAWEISRGAGVREGLCAPGDAPLRLEIALPLRLRENSLRVGPITARLIDGGDERALEVPSTPGVCITDLEAGLTHVDVPGLLHVSLRTCEPRRPLYARTTLMTSLGIGGGQYEPASCELRQG